MKRLGIISHQILSYKGCMNYGWIVFCGMRDALQEGKIIISDFRRRLIRREWWKMKQIASHIPLAIRLFFWKIAQFWWCQIVLTNENDLPKKEFLPKKPLSQNISTNFKFIVPSQTWKHSHPYNFVEGYYIILSKMTSISNQNSLQKDSFGSWIQLRKSRWRAIARIPI